MKSSLFLLIVAIGFASCLPVEDQTKEITESIVPVLVAPIIHSIDEFLHLFIAIQPPVPIGRADGVNVFQFLYENIAAPLFTGLATNTANYLQGSLQALLDKPFGIGKRHLQGDLVARMDFLSFFYDNILQGLFSDIMTNTLTTISGALNNLIQTNPLGIGKRADGVNVFQFLYDNVIADLFGGLATNTANYLQNSLQNLLNKPFGIGKRSISNSEIQSIFAAITSTLIPKLRDLMQETVVAVWDKDQGKFLQLIATALSEIKSTMNTVAQQLFPLIPSELFNQASEILAGLQSLLIFWSSGLAGSLGPVLLPPH